MKQLFKQTLFLRREIPILAILFACSVIGLLSGYLASRTITAAESESLRSYVQQYASLIADKNVGNATISTVAITYLRYPVILFLLGFTAWGTFLIPLICVGQGFFLSYAVSGFVASLGRTGVLLAVSTFGIRCLITLPCILLIGVRSMESALMLRHERCRSKHKQFFSPNYGTQLALCLLLLILGITADFKIVPRLLQIVIRRIG